jgi:competence protein ComEC
VAPALVRVYLVLAALWLGTVWGWAGDRRLVWMAVGAAGLAGVVSRRSAVARLSGMSAVALALGGLGASTRSSSTSPVHELAHEVPRCAIRGRVVEGLGGLGTLVAVDEARCAGFFPVAPAGAVVMDGSVGDAGSEVTGEGWMVPLGDDPFDVARTRAGAGASFDATDVTVVPPRAGPLAIAAGVRDGLRSATSSVDARRAALLRGLAIGDTGDLDPVTIERFRRAGLSHVLAVSGTNVAIVLGSVAFAARAVPLRARLALGYIVLCLFVLVVGPEPSVLRAAAMGALGLVALAWGRSAEPLHGLGLALIIVLATRPAMAFSVGLGLSAGATAGMVLWARPLAARLPVLPRPLALAIGATLAAQVAVMPLLLGVFGELSVVAPIANVLALPAVAPATVAALAAGLVSLIHADVGGIVAAVAAPFAGWVLWVGDHFGAAPIASVDVPKVFGVISGVPVIAAAVAALAGGERSAGNRPGETVTRPHGARAGAVTRRGSHSPAASGFPG